MPLLEDEQKLPTHRLLKIELPLFLLALLVSVFIHQYAHTAVYRKTCAGVTSTGLRTTSAFAEGTADCPAAALAGTVATFITAIASFAIYIRNTNNLFFGSMAFINATLRLPEAVAVFFQLLLRQKTDLTVDESLALRMLHLQDPAVGILILCFFSLTIFFLAITIIHDTRILPRKWAIASCLFVVIIPLEIVLRRVIEPIFL
jgi:hypothetical protein